ncbi:MAG: hypothetical protein BM564_10070 [Bacteroidetes bacterium MedPE-SWsnd-G2]|nr:MAG: hypothetical protein BM564_10070 [Bacteroidetes bacterium MedPE-SWsnd-G2]
MKNYALAILALLVLYSVNAQETIIFDNQSSVITTAVPFMLIAPDARAAGMGDLGVATSVDAFASHWNPSKTVFSEYKSGLGVSYTPYLSKLVNDISIGYVTYYNRLNERSSFTASFKYFSLGEIEIREDQFSDPLIEKPNELTIDASYALRLADQFSMAVSLRYLRSDLRIQAVDQTANAASSIAVDITGYYQSEEEAYNDFNGRWRFGFALQNLGPKIKYDDNGQENFLPSTLRLGGGFDFIFDDYNKLSVTAEVAKLLVPTPPIYGFVDTDGDGMQNEIDDPNTPEDEREPTIIVEGKDDNVSFGKGLFQSFGDAPGGFSEEMSEFTWALGAEYNYDDAFMFRAGYFHESEDKGARQFFALGAGFKYTTINLDLSYLFSASKVQSPLENTLRFTLTFNFGDGEYQEY